MSALNSTLLYSVVGEDNQLVAGAIGAAAILATTVVYYALSSKDKEREFPKLRGIQLYHAWNFFRRRYDFLQSNFKQNLGKSFSFNVLHHNVIALTGEDARHALFSSPHLNLGEGFKLLMGGAPRVSDVDTEKDVEEGNIALFNKKLNKLSNRTHMQDVFPTLVQDITNKADKWGNDGKNGRIDPFTEIYDLVFAMTARIATCDDLAKNEADLKKAGELFMTLQASATPTSLLLPWFPSPAGKTGKRATTELYTMLRGYVESRRHAPEFQNDAFDILIADGETTRDIVGFVMTVLFAGVINTGIISCWMLIDLAIHPEWREKCKKEIQDLISRHSGDYLSSATLGEKLGAIPVSAWENELPVLEACIRETHRIYQAGIALRRNIREEIKIGEQVIKRGDFLVYHFDDVQLNPEYYPEPYKYDPGRWLRPDPVPDTIYPFLGWGVGRHPCSGMKMAKLEMKLISAMFLMRYEYDLVDEDGKFPDPLPVPDRNDIHQSRPLGATYYFSFERVVQ